MKTIHQFGDSYGEILYNNKIRDYRIKNFIELSAEQLGYMYNNKAFSGYSNEMILNIILQNLNNIKEGDMIFINFSFFARGCWYDDVFNKIKSTNELYDELNNNTMFFRKKNENVVNLVEYYLNQTKDYNMRIFKLIDSILKYLKLKNIDIFYIFVDDSIWVNELLSVGTNIKFPDGFAKWLVKNNFGLEEESHYTKGIQPILCKTILDKTKNFTNTSKNIYVDINDVDLNIEIQKPIKQKLL